MRFEYVLGLFIALKKQLEDEDKERKKQEDEAGGTADISSYTSQAHSMIGDVTRSMPKVSMPSMPHL